MAEKYNFWGDYMRRKNNGDFDGALKKWFEENKFSIDKKYFIVTLALEDQAERFSYPPEFPLLIMTGVVDNNPIVYVSDPLTSTEYEYLDDAKIHKTLDIPNKVISAAGKPTIRDALTLNRKDGTQTECYLLYDDSHVSKIKKLVEYFKKLTQTSVDTSNT